MNENNVISMIKREARVSYELSLQNQAKIKRIQESLEKINDLMMQLKSGAFVKPKDIDSQVEL
jgi:hypothetical protein